LAKKKELAGRCSQFMNKCMISECDIVKLFVRHGIVFSRMYSPIGRNAFNCSSHVGVKLKNISAVLINILFGDTWRRVFQKLDTFCSFAS